MLILTILLLTRCVDVLNFRQCMLSYPQTQRDSPGCAASLGSVAHSLPQPLKIEEVFQGISITW